MTEPTEPTRSTEPAGPAVPSGPSRRAYILGTPFCGSTVFGQALGVSPAVSYLGEVDRLVQFPGTMFAEEPEPTCHHCELLGQPCPVWTEERVAAARALPYGRLMDFFESEIDGSVMLDGSKHPHWLRSVMDDEPVDRDRTVAFVAVRSPFAFCNSYQFRTGCPTWQAANVWRDVYYDAIRLVTRAGLPFMVVRYEDFALDPEPELRSACTLLGVPYDAAMPYFQKRPTHDVGGNYSVFAAPREPADQFSSDAFRDRLPEPLAERVEQDQAYWDYWGKPFGGWVDDKWQRSLTAADVEQVLQTPGLADVANLLGYQLTAEVQAWQRRQTALEAERTAAAASAPEGAPQPS